MDEFFDSNPGMNSRIACHLDFGPYDLGELFSIGELMLHEANYRLSPAAEAVIGDYVAHQMTEPSFANARSVRNNLDRARLRHANGLAVDSGRRWSRHDLMRLEPEDILEGDPRLVVGSAALSNER